MSSRHPTVIVENGERGTPTDDGVIGKLEDLIFDFNENRHEGLSACRSGDLRA
jgi:hypothetical protein